MVKSYIPSSKKVSSHADIGLNELNFFHYITKKRNKRKANWKMKILVEYLECDFIPDKNRHTYNFPLKELLIKNP